MNLPTALTIVGSSFALAIMVINLFKLFVGNRYISIKPECTSKFKKMEDLNEVSMGETVEKFKDLTDKVQTEMFEISTLKNAFIEFKESIVKSIDEMKSEIREISKYIRENPYHDRRK